MEWGAALAGYVRHLASDRGFSEHTIRAYRTDLEDLARFAELTGAPTIESLDLELLRDWLWRGASSGLAKSTLGRHAASARGFTRWLVSSGLAEADAGARLKAPRPDQHLPRVLTRPQIEGILAGWQDTTKLHGSLYEDALALKYAHQRYSGYLAWLRWSGA